MNRIVSINEIEHAFDDLLHTITRIEKTLESQTEIEINEMNIAQLEKIVYLNSCLSRVDVRPEAPTIPTFKLVLGR